MKRLFTLFICLLTLAGAATAQQTVLPCGSTQAWNELIQRDPSVKRGHDALEEWTRDFLSNAGARQTLDDDSVLVIPIVIHVMHAFGPENVSQAQIDDAIRIINEDFSLRSRDTNQITNTFRPIAGNSRIEFRLARKDPQGNCTIGVTRTIISTAYANAGDDGLKNLVRWPASKYLNVWVCNNIASGAGAYAYLPSPGISAIDGIVCRAAQFGSIGASNSGNGAARTLTHEIGHYLNLSHTWGGGNTPGVAVNCNNDDGVQDTPNCIGVSDQSCRLTVRSCGAALPDNVENYMDYSSCGRMFTNGQKARMRAASFSNIASRSNLWTQANLVATGTDTRGSAPICVPSILVPPFNFKKCPGQAVRFYVSLDGAATDQVTYQWQFPGSNTPTSTDAYPNVTYVTPGIYPVKLKVSNSAGADSIELDSSVLVRNPYARYFMGDSETFSAPAFPVVSDSSNQFWEFENADARKGWVRSTTIGATDQTSLFSNLRILTTTGNIYSVLSPAFNLANYPQNSFLVFRYASAKRATSARDEFKVYASTNCGAQWNTLFTRTSTTTPNVYTNGAATSAPFLPTSDQFVEQRFNIRNYVGQASVRFKFEVKVGGGGNAIYMDNVQVLAGPTAISDRDLLKDIQIMPNPSSTLVQIDLPSWPDSKPVSYDLLSPLGQKVISGRSEGNNFVMDVSPLAKGIYILSLEGQKSQRIVVE